jgi:hypothetical protein
VVGGRIYSSGAVPTEAAFTDDPASASSIRLGHDGRAEGSFEIRRWAPDLRYGRGAVDDVVGDAFVFAREGEARAFFATASGARCHRHAKVLPAVTPSTVTNLSWLNPDRVVQEDAYLLRGRRVYRFTDVPPENSSMEAMRWGLQSADRLACTVSEAGCSGGAQSGAVTSAPEWTRATSRETPDKGLNLCQRV